MTELVVAAWKKQHIERLVDLQLGRDLDDPVTEEEVNRVCGLDPGIKIVYVEDWMETESAHGLHL